ncbi:MAG: hypothetical protein OEY66_12750 [Gammaproteobacteria bacterium]|nr:hypothetical protein [Gammaproteobacteria bacterium]
MNKGIYTINLVLGHAITVALVSAILVYGFDYYDKAYGKGISFQIYLWGTVLGVIITGVGFSIGVFLSDNISKYWVGFCIGGLFACAIVITTYLISLVTYNTGLKQFLLFTSWFLGSIFTPILISKIKAYKNG